MVGSSVVVFRRHRMVSIVALVLLAGLSWAWIVTGAGMGMAPQLSLTFFPQRSPGMTMNAPWDAPRLLLNFSMWFVMMVAMMIPAAAPVVLLYGRVVNRNAAQAPPTGLFLAGYLLAWALFSLFAVLLQMALETVGAMTGMGMVLSSRWTAGALLIASGLYQLSSWKNACLSHCRNPADFLVRHHRSAPIVMGLTHGSYCVGCCWLLMALLFVGGIMNLAWIGALTLIVAAEKMLPNGRTVARVGGVLFLAWGAAVLIAG